MELMQAKKNERVTISMPVEDVRRLKHAAVDAGLSTSSIVREALGPILRRADDSQSNSVHGDKAAA